MRNHLALAGRQANIVRRLGANLGVRRVRDLRVERLRRDVGQYLLPSGDRADRLDELVDGGVLEDESRDADLDELLDLLVHREQVHHDDARLRQFPAEDPDQVQAVLVAEASVEQDDVRPFLRQVRRVRDWSGDDADVRELSQQRRECLAYQPVVLDDRERKRRICGHMTESDGESSHREAMHAPRPRSVPGRDIDDQHPNGHGDRDDDGAKEELLSQVLLEFRHSVLPKAQAIANARHSTHA